MIKRHGDMRITGGRSIFICVHLGTLSNRQISAILNTGYIEFQCCLHVFFPVYIGFSTGFVNYIHSAFPDKDHKMSKFFFFMFLLFSCFIQSRDN